MNALMGRTFFAWKNNMFEDCLLLVNEVLSLHKIFNKTIITIILII